MKFIKIKILIPLLLSALCSVVSAERSAQMLYFRAPKESPQHAVVYQNGKNSERLSLPRNNFSESFKLAKGDVVLQFLPTELAPDSRLPENAPSVHIPKHWEKVLILAFTDSSNPVFPVRFKVINADAGKFGPGDRMFINFTDSDVFGFVGKQKLTLKSNSTKVVKNAAGPMEEFQARLDRIDPVSKKRVTFIRQIWRQSATRRSLMFIYSPPGSTAVTYYNAPVRNL